MEETDSDGEEKKSHSHTSAPLLFFPVLFFLFFMTGFMPKLTANKITMTHSCTGAGSIDRLAVQLLLPTFAHKKKTNY